MKRTRIDWIVVAIAIFVAAGGCGGGCGGCAGMEPIPGGFPANERVPNAGQLRVTQTAIAKIEADPAGVLGPIAGGGSTAPGKIVLDISGGKIEIDLNKAAPSEAARLELNPAQGSGRIDVVVRARVKTLMDLAFDTGFGTCSISVDSTQGTIPDFTITLPINMTADPETGTTRISAGNANIGDLQGADYDVGGGGVCGLANFIPASTIAGLMADQIETAVNDQTCKVCTTVADCGSSFATACTDGVCEKQNGDCFQELGLAGRLRGSILFASLSPGTTGAMDLYEVAGGYATSNNNGVALGLLGGMLPAGEARDRCGPPAIAPARATIAQSAFFQGNIRPDTSATFDVGIGIHKSQLDALAFSGYDGGLFCLTVGSSTVAQLSTDTIGLLSRSLGKLVETNSAMAVGLRPQAPPTIVLGRNTFVDDGNGTMVPDEPLLDITFTALEIDFFASIDDQYNRVFTVVADVHLPIGLQTTAMGELAPVIGNADMAFTNLSVKNSEAVTESPAELAGLFPTLLGLVLPQLSGGLSPIALPEIGGLALSVTDVTAVDNMSYLAIYANLVPASMPRIVDTRVELESIYEPPTQVASDPAQWRTAKPPAVRLNLDGNDKNLEFSWRTNAGAWSGWSQNRHPLVTVPAFWLPGVHKLEVRAREIGRPETIDREPVMIDLLMGTDVQLASDRKPSVIGFHGQAGAAGCSCETSSPTGGVLLAFVIAGLVFVPRRKRALRRMLRSASYTAGRLGLVVWIAAIMSLPGCSCGSNPCGDADCLPGEVEHGAGGRWTSIAGDSDRVMVATYDSVLGDLMAVDATDPSDLKYVAVDGIADETPVYDPGTYRGGIEGAGDNVGAWTSIAIEGGIARIAYQDRDAGTLKYAYETKTGGKWESHVVDGGDVQAGQYASMVIDGDKRPAIAYLALGIDDGAGHRNVELRIARAGNSNPEATSDWTHALIAAAPGTCGGLCGGQSCVAGAAATDPQECVTATTDCATACAETEVCVTGTCRAFFDEPKVVSLPGGTGLYVSLVVLPDGRLAAAFYDMTRRALVLAAEATRGGNDFAETVLDGNAPGRDRGMWATAVAGDDGVVHIGYQDALGDQLMYTTWNGAAGTPEVVDNGVRAGDRPHPVGTGSSIYLDAGAPVIAYQDGLVSDAMLASRGSGSWTSAPLAAGPLLDGFSIAATTGHGSPAIAWGSMDPALPIPMTLVVGSP